VLADLAAANPRRLLARLETQTRQQSAADYQDALEGLQTALRHTPDAPSLWARLGDLEAAAAVAELQGAGAGAKDLLAKAEAHYAQAIQLRPTAPALWVSLADTQFSQGQTDAGWQSWRRAMALGPYEQGVRAQAMDMAFKDWPRAPADVQRWLEQQFDDASPEERAEINAEAKLYGLAFSSDR
jgi:tetratricopeptide (TPR) repeat protein